MALELLTRILQANPRERSRPLKVMPFGPWLPDAPKFDNPGCVRAQNVMPYGPHGYRPFPDFSAVTTTPLTARCQGAASAVSSEGITHSYAGDATKLYRQNDTTWTDASRTSGGAYALGGEEFWEFLKFDNTILACQVADHVQGMTIGSANFANQFTSVLKPLARHMCRGNRFLMLGNTSESGTVYPTRVRWGKIDSTTDMDEVAASQSGYRDVDGDGGWIQRMIGGSFVTIYQEHSIQIGQYVGSPAIWKFDIVEKNRGCGQSPYGVVALGRIHFVLAHDGFFLFDGLECHPIGEGKVNHYFFDNASASYNFRVCSAIDPESHLVMWAFVSTSATGANPNPDRILLYHWPSGWWAVAHVTVEWLYNDLTRGPTLEGLDSISSSLDDLPFSLDSRAWTGGVRTVSAFNTAHNSGTFTGSNLAAIIETSVRQLFPGRTARVRGAHVLVDGGSPTLAIAAQKRLNDTQTFGSTASQRTEGYVPLHSSARYHAFQFNMAAGQSWTHAQGVQPIAAPAGDR